MKLYYTPGACSLASHILAHEAGLGLELVKVDLATHRTENGDDFTAVNSKGYVPALRLDNGEVLTESMVVLQYLADRAPQAGLVPPAGSLARYRLQEWLAFIGTELHKGFGPLWSPEVAETVKAGARARLAGRFAWLEPKLAAQPFLMGDGFTAADCYAFVVLSWADYHKLDMTPYPNLRAYVQRIAARPAVVKALQEEGLA